MSSKGGDGKTLLFYHSHHQVASKPFFPLPLSSIIAANSSLLSFQPLYLFFAHSSISQSHLLLYYNRDSLMAVPFADEDGRRLGS